MVGIVVMMRVLVIMVMMIMMVMIVVFVLVFAVRVLPVHRLCLGSISCPD
jgi:hypothetical protein